MNLELPYPCPSNISEDKNIKIDQNQDPSVKTGNQDDVSFSDDFAQNKPSSSEYTKISENNINNDLQMDLQVDETNHNIFEKSPPKSTIGDKTLNLDDSKEAKQTD